MMKIYILSFVELVDIITHAFMNTDIPCTFELTFSPATFAGPAMETVCTVLACPGAASDKTCTWVAFAPSTYRKLRKGQGSDGYHSW
jgi:hypothetical protein